MLRTGSAKDLIPLRVDSVKNLVVSIGCSTEILRLTPQNDITTWSLEGEGSLPAAPGTAQAGVRVKVNADGYKLLRLDVYLAAVGGGDQAARH